MGTIISSLNAKLKKPLISWNIPWFLNLLRLSKIWRTEKLSTYRIIDASRLSVLRENKIWNSPNSEKKISQYVLISIFTKLGGHILDGVCPASVQLENQDLEWCLDVTKANYMKLREGPQVIEANPWRQSKASKWWPWRRMFRHLRFQPIKIELVRLWSCKVYHFFVFTYITMFGNIQINFIQKFQRWVSYACQFQSGNLGHFKGYGLFKNLEKIQDQIVICAKRKIKVQIEYGK